MPYLEASVPQWTETLEDTYNSTFDFFSLQGVFPPIDFLQEHLGISYSAAVSRLLSLERQGLIRRTGKHWHTCVFTDKSPREVPRLNTFEEKAEGPKDFILEMIVPDIGVAEVLGFDGDVVTWKPLEARSNKSRSVRDAVIRNCPECLKVISDNIGLEEEAIVDIVDAILAELCSDVLREEETNGMGSSRSLIRRYNSSFSALFKWAREQGIMRRALSNRK